MITLSQSSRLALYLLMAVPAAAFMFSVIHYGINIPLYDDITQILWITNQFLDPDLTGTPENIYAIANPVHAIFYPNAGHVPMFTRLFALTQYQLGGINFHYAIIAACAAWAVTVFCWMRELEREGYPLYALLPLPYLLFSLVQWEAMHMMLGGLQVYFGTLFLPMLMLWLVVRKQVVAASVVFFVALFACGGALLLLPLGLAFLLWERAWRQAALLLFLCMPSVVLFQYLNVFRVQSVSLLEDFELKLHFLFAFLGNITTNGSYDLSELRQAHEYTGMGLLLVGFIGFLKCPGRPFLKLLIAYVFMLSVVTSLSRAVELVNVMPRYSVFALLGAAVAYLLMTGWFMQHSVRVLRVWCAASILPAILLWGYCYPKGNQAFDYWRNIRVADMQHYVATGDATRLLWLPDWGKSILDKSQRLGVYDYRAAAQDP